jgi:hypothetical protein
MTKPKEVSLRTVAAELSLAGKVVLVHAFVQVAHPSTLCSIGFAIIKKQSRSAGHARHMAVRMQKATNHVQGQNNSWAEVRLKFALKLRVAFRLP